MHMRNIYSLCGLALPMLTAAACALHQLNQ